MDRKDRIEVTIALPFWKFGCALAIAISFTMHKSILWAILHGIFSWLYVIYYAITR